MSLDSLFLTGKIAANETWLEAYRRGEVVAPVCMEIDLTDRCNYSCPNCVWGDYISQDANLVPRERALAIVRNCAEAGVRAIIFSGGGEPLLNPATPDAMILAKSLSLDVGLFTNGLPITPAIAGTLVDCCSWIRIHLDGATPQTYSARHGTNGSQLERLHNAVTDLNRRARGASKPPDVGIGSVINYGTFPDLRLLVQFALRTGCTFFQAKPDIKMITDVQYREWWTSDVMPWLASLTQEFAQTSMVLHYEPILAIRPQAAFTCHIHHLTTAIKASGQVSYCKRLRDVPQWHVGNIFDETLRQIVSGEVNRRLSHVVTPHTCGIACPYIELNEFLDRIVTLRQPPPSPSEMVRHAHFF